MLVDGTAVAAAAVCHKTIAVAPVASVTSKSAALSGTVPEDIGGSLPTRAVMNQRRTYGWSWMLRLGRDRAARATCAALTARAAALTAVAAGAGAGAAVMVVVMKRWGGGRQLTGLV